MTKYFIILSIFSVISGCSSTIGNISGSENKEKPTLDTVSSNFSYNNLSIISIPVGTGTCQIVSCPNSKKMIINDCGSNGIGPNGLNQDQAAFVINDIIVQAKLNQLVVTISHPDKDHLSYIKGIVDYIGNNAFKGKLGKIIEYSYVTDNYPESYSSVEKFLKDNSNHFNQFKSPVSNKYSTPELGCGSDSLKTWVLAAKYGNGDSNTSSIVLGSVIKGNDLFYFTGDMTSDTSKEIINYYTKLNPMTFPYDKDNQRVIMSASHHGADSHGSNDEEWINFSKPNALIFNTGYRSGYGHPRCKVYKNYEKYLSDGYFNHSITCFTDATNSVNKDTTKFVFSTYSNGYVIASWLNGNLNFDTTSGFKK